MMKMMTTMIMSMGIYTITISMSRSPQPIKPLTWRERLHNRISYWLFRQFQVKQGPMMFHIRGEWWFVDHYGNIWIIRYKAQYDYPFDIVLFHRP